MSYIKASKVLPAELLEAVQKYISGQSLYIPRKEGGKRAWGALTKSKLLTAERNKNIFRLYKMGRSVRDLSAQFFLSDKAIYKIIACIKYKK